MTSTEHSRFTAWLLEGAADPQHARHPGPLRKVDEADPQQRSWWRVMCLTGVDYFSTLGYQPGIAAIAAGALSPLATLVLVSLTLFGALPVYRRVARESPNGGGSLAMFADALPRWTGKFCILILLGFACTDFVITMTLSAADGAAHIIENPFAPAAWQDSRLIITLLLLGLLAAVFLKGFREAIGIAVVLVGVYLSLNAIVGAVGLWHVFTSEHRVIDWTEAMTTEHGSVWMMIAVSLLVFPKLALGLSGFETGVAVMPLIKGEPGDTPEYPRGRIIGARKLLTTAALIMSGFLLVSSFITVVLIPEQAFEPGGAANGRALAYLAHEYLGNGFGTVYDVATIAILWFAGASALAGLLNLVPRYLPRYGMAPEWARATRPLVLVFAVVAFGITWYFDADVDAQGAAYATGVLVLITSAAAAVTLSAHRKGERRKAIGFAVVTAVFVYTTITNVFERPEGVHLATLFILAVVGVSLASRVRRAFELRAIEVSFDAAAARLIDAAAATGVIRIIAHDVHERTPERYAEKEAVQRRESHIPGTDSVLFLEVDVADASEFSTDLRVTAAEVGEHRVLGVEAAAVPNSIAAILFAVRDRTGLEPHIYFEWTEGDPIARFLEFLFLGSGEIAPVTREIIRRAEPDPARRPHVHVDS
ncbi:amino acid transporter [Nocardia asteroides]|uniref:amino acid transporter n=1 Tax=Nocardia asteroides TaxID=1824 RepID=UPI0037CC4E04